MLMSEHNCISRNGGMSACEQSAASLAVCTVHICPTAALERAESRLDFLSCSLGFALHPLTITLVHAPASYSTFQRGYRNHSYTRSSQHAPPTDSAPISALNAFPLNFLRPSRIPFYDPRRCPHRSHLQDPLAATRYTPLPRSFRAASHCQRPSCCPRLAHGAGRPHWRRQGGEVGGTSSRTRSGWSSSVGRRYRWNWRQSGHGRVAVRDRLRRKDRRV